MTSEIRFKTMQEASKQIVAAHEKVFRPFEDETRAVRAVTLLLYIEKHGGKYVSCSAQALLRDGDLPQSMLINILTDQLLRASGATEFDEQFTMEARPDGSIIGKITTKKDKGE